jgi:hypothetical protein
VLHYARLERLAREKLPRFLGHPQVTKKMKQFEYGLRYLSFTRDFLTIVIWGIEIWQIVAAATASVLL